MVGWGEQCVSNVTINERLVLCNLLTSRYAESSFDIIIQDRTTI